MPPDVHARLFADFGFFAPNGTQIVGYPIAGVDNDLRAGHRRYNFVWYAAVTDGALRDMLTDANGTYHAISIPPPLIRDDVLSRMEADAARRLPAAFVEIIRKSGRPFFTPIYDHISPVFAEGRVALAGDAACVARPHVGMGVTKAAEDALALARYLSAQPVEAALQAARDHLAQNRCGGDVQFSHSILRLVQHQAIAGAAEAVGQDQIRAHVDEGLVVLRDSLWIVDEPQFRSVATLQSHSEKARASGAVGQHYVLFGEHFFKWIGH